MHRLIASCLLITTPLLLNAEQSFNDYLSSQKDGFRSYKNGGSSAPKQTEVATPKTKPVVFKQTKPIKVTAPKPVPKSPVVPKPEKKFVHIDVSKKQPVTMVKKEKKKSVTVFSTQGESDRKTITKSTFVNQANYPNSSMDEIKKILLEKVKIAAATEIYGDFIKSENDIENGKLIRSCIISEKNGLIHIEGEPIYGNGENFGDIKVTVVAYATKDELDSMKVHTINVDKYVYANEALPIQKLKKEAEDNFIVHAIAQVKPEILKASNPKRVARSLAKGIKMKTMKFDMSKASYTMGGTVQYIPFFIKYK